ncbi:hypothetical protein TPY_2694 [Sulfobacillus acidophilus TPY]|nr:hypothetical protein TPY_2694 [Sulfobacillus acidophilus TPY]
MVGAIILALSLGLFGWSVGETVGLRGGVRWIPPQPAMSDTQWDIGPTLSPGVWTALWAGSIGLTAILVWRWTGNVPMTMLYGWAGQSIPGAILTTMRRRRLRVLDTQAYVMANSLRTLLPVANNLEHAVQLLVSNLDAPLRPLVTRALASEAEQSGQMVEQLRQAGRALGLADLELMADILQQIRSQTYHALPLLTRLVELWGERLQQEARRAGKITGSFRLASALLLVSIGVQLGWPALSPSAHAALSSIIGQVAGGFGAGVTMVAWTVYQRTQNTALNPAKAPSRKSRRTSRTVSI